VELFKSAQKCLQISLDIWVETKQVLAIKRRRLNSRSSDALKWNELEMAAIHTDNTKFIDRLWNQNINPAKEDQLPIITGPHINRTKIECRKTSSHQHDQLCTPEPHAAGSVELKCTNQFGHASQFKITSFCHKHDWWKISYGLYVKLNVYPSVWIYRIAGFLFSTTYFSSSQ
jgi:hypothetical protein